MSRSRAKKTLVFLLKVGISVGLLSFLFYKASENPGTFDRLLTERKDWPALAGAFCCTFTAVLITFVRWYFLVRALDLPFTIKDALRLGFVGYMANFISLGSVGGDLFKAFFIAREQHGRRAEAVATVIIDRLVGLYALLVVASAAVLAAGLLWRESTPAIRNISMASLALTLAGAVAIAMLLLPGSTGGKVSHAASRLPYIGHTLHRLIAAVRIYRQKYPIVALALLMSIAVHMLLSVSIFLIAVGLGMSHPSLGEHFLVVPLAMLASALPLPGGLGALEAALDYLYVFASPGGKVVSGDGLVVALGFRVITIVIASIGACYWLSSRREVALAMHDAEEVSEV